MIGKDINTIIFSLTVLGKTDEEISDAITIHPHVAFFLAETPESYSAHSVAGNKSPIQTVGQCKRTTVA